MLFKIAIRNILRNRRRSATAVLALCVSAIAMLLFGAFMSSLVLGIKTGAIQDNGQLTIYHKGYLDFGTGDPGRYSIGHYQGLIDSMRNDAVLGPMINVIAPRVSVFGIAGNGKTDRSTTFFGFGFIPSNHKKIQEWNGYHIRIGARTSPGMSDAQETSGVIGVGLARILGLCAPLHIDGCIAPLPTHRAKDAAANLPDRDFSALESQNIGHGQVVGAASPPSINLLGATAGGAPNVVTLKVAGTQQQASRQSDNSYVGMPLSLAQQLLYGRGSAKVTSIVVQLHRTADMPVARARLQGLLAKHGGGFEVSDFLQQSPFLKQVIALFGTIFAFIALIMGVIVLFTVANSMSMTVIDRTNEIGTVRAMGVQREGIARQFLTEGCLLGLVGASLGVLLASLIAALINGAKLSWIPPGYVHPAPLRLLVWGYPQLPIGTWVGLIVIVALAALLPARKAARMTVVDALRHV